MGLAAARSDQNSAILAGLEMVAKQFQDFLTETGSADHRRGGAEI